jgi:ribosome-binding factor A
VGGPLRPAFDDLGGRSAKPDYKTAALCKQVRRVVSLALAGECGDPVLQELLVDEVLPAPNAGRLLVRVMLRAREGGPGVIDVLRRLAAVEGMLRADVAEAIARKRAPELAFEVVPCGGIGVAPMSPEEGPRNPNPPAPSADDPPDETAAEEAPHA